MGERLLVREDEEVSQLARDALERDGVRVLTGHKALRARALGVSMTNAEDGARVNSLLPTRLVDALAHLQRRDAGKFVGAGVEHVSGPRDDCCALGISLVTPSFIAGLRGGDLAF